MAMIAVYAGYKGYKKYKKRHDAKRATSKAGHDNENDFLDHKPGSPNPVLPNVSSDQIVPGVPTQHTDDDGLPPPYESSDHSPLLQSSQMCEEPYSPDDFGSPTESVMGSVTQMLSRGSTRSEKPVAPGHEIESQPPADFSSGAFICEMEGDMVYPLASAEVFEMAGDDPVSAMSPAPLHITKVNSFRTPPPRMASGSSPSYAEEHRMNEPSEQRVGPCSPHSNHPHSTPQEMSSTPIHPMRTATTRMSQMDVVSDRNSIPPRSMATGQSRTYNEELPGNHHSVLNISPPMRSYDEEQNQSRHWMQRMADHPIPQDNTPVCGNSRPQSMTSGPMPLHYKQQRMNQPLAPRTTLPSHHEGETEIQAVARKMSSDAIPQTSTSTNSSLGPPVTKDTAPTAPKKAMSTASPPKMVPPLSSQRSQASPVKKVLPPLPSYDGYEYGDSSDEDEEEEPPVAPASETPPQHILAEQSSSSFTAGPESKDEVSLIPQPERSTRIPSSEPTDELSFRPLRITPKLPAGRSRRSSF